MRSSNVLGKGRTALVTGASRGIGRLIARDIAARGGRVVLIGRSASDLATVASDLSKSGATVSAVPADLTELDSIEALVATIAQRFGGIDLLVNNAGGDPQRRFDVMSFEDNLQIIRLNLLAPIALTHALLDGMLERGRGHIVNISAIAGRIAFPYTEAYAAAKDGLIGFTRVLRSDYHERGVSASAVILGAIGGAGQGQRTMDEMGIKQPPFLVSADDVAKAVVKAVDHDRAEIVMLPGPGRLIKAALDLFPGLGPTLNRASGSNKVMTNVIEFREAKRNALVR